MIISSFFRSYFLQMVYPKRFLLLIKMHPGHLSLSSAPLLFCCSASFQCPRNHSWRLLVRSCWWFQPHLLTVLAQVFFGQTRRDLVILILRTWTSAESTVSDLLVQVSESKRMRVNSIAYLLVDSNAFVDTVRAPLIRRAGTLYAGDGVVIQSSQNQSTGFPTDCIAILRYPRSSFAYGNMSLCVCCKMMCMRFSSCWLLVCLQFVVQGSIYCCQPKCKYVSSRRKNQLWSTWRRR